jgi:outer membrane protein assembly factor BamB
MHACRTFAVFGLAHALICSPASAGDWPQFRGPTGDGICTEATLPLEWGPAKNVAWKVNVPGKGWSSPITGGGRLYLTTAVQGPSNDVSLRALCLEAKTGKTLWDAEVFQQDAKSAPAIHGKNSHASPTPLLCEGRLFVHFGHQGSACLDLNGKVLWRNRTLGYQPVHGNGGSPICVDDLLVYNADGADSRSIVALDRATGAVRWKTAREWRSQQGFSFSTPTLIMTGGRRQIISAASDAVAAYDPADGKEIWRVEYDGGYSVIPKPVFGHGLVFVCTGYNQPSMLAIRPDGRGDVTDTHVAWKTTKGVPNTPSLLLVGDELYMVSDNGVASCCDASTGKMHWQQRLGPNYSASPLFGAGRIYFQSENGLTTILEAGKTFKLLTKNALGERSLASFAAADGALFIRTEDKLYRIQ